MDNAWEGFNACLFAYGQTGSGKSYSIVGYGENKGIIPRTCEEIFRRIAEKAAKEGTKSQYSVSISMIEIYNEKVQDLFTKPEKRPKEGLKIREDPTKGVYVESAIFSPVNSYEEIEKQIEWGTVNRTIGSTNMNATSSRAHTVTQLVFKQKFFNDSGKPERELISNINLIDLAGSERASGTGATGDRLKEGANINKSLTMLGQVISALAKAQGGKSKEIVPYRNSKLTYILKPFLGGNAKTAMIAALSPANINYDETMSTLRYADGVKKIKNKAIVNESPQDKLIRELKEEIEKLRLGGGGAGGGGGGGANGEDVAR